MLRCAACQSRLIVVRDARGQHTTGHKPGCPQEARESHEADVRPPQG